MIPKIAIIRFPGTNRHQEAFKTIKDVGMNPVYVKWNEDPKYIASFDGYLLAGGFSYEDRSRAGIIAALDPVMEVIRKQAKKGKAIIGICNGAQMIIESGIVPGSEDTRMCIAESVRQTQEKILGTGFINHWVHLKMVGKPKRSAFNYSYTEPKALINCIIAHGEGRYVSIDPNLCKNLYDNDQILFQYCNASGEVLNAYPINPNGSTENIAGIINKEGNVLAIMPHPEQYCHLAKPLFQSMKDYIVDGNTTSNLVIPKTHISYFEVPKIQKRELGSHTVRLHIRLIITDTEEQTILDTLSSLKIDATVKKFRSLEIEVKKDWETVMKNLIDSGAVCNLNKEYVIVEKDNTFYSYEKGDFHTTTSPFSSYTLFIIPRGNYPGKELYSKLQNSDIQNLFLGKTWSIKGDKDAVLKSNILYNFHSQEAYLIS